MRKLELQVQMTVDGFISGPIGEMDWMVWDWDEKLKQYVADITEAVDCIVLGRKLAEGFIPHWANVASNQDDWENVVGRKFTDTKKVVFTKTLEKSDRVVLGWNNTSLAKGNLIDEINQLKKQDGKDIIAYGGAKFVSALIKHQLIDEFHLFINPAALGNGMTIFSESGNMQKLKLLESTKFDCGIVVLKYIRKEV